MVYVCRIARTLWALEHPRVQRALRLSNRIRHSVAPWMTIGLSMCAQIERSVGIILSPTSHRLLHLASLTHLPLRTLGWAQRKSLCHEPTTHTRWRTSLRALDPMGAPRSHLICLLQSLEHRVYCHQHRLRSHAGHSRPWLFIIIFTISTPSQLSIPLYHLPSLSSGGSAYLLPHCLSAVLSCPSFFSSTVTVSLSTISFLGFRVD